MSVEIQLQVDILFNLGQTYAQMAGPDNLQNAVLMYQKSAKIIKDNNV